MKVLISTDMEGISGVVSSEETMYAGRDYEKARHWITGDANAAVEGAIAGGADEVYVVDVHGFQLNILWDQLHPKARLVRGAAVSNRPLFVLEGLDKSFDLCLFVGFHATGGLGPGVLNHTYLGTKDFFEVRLNGEPASEAKIAAAAAGALGVPVGLITGDDVTCGEMKAWAPDVETAVVKYAVDRQAACLLPQQEAHALIREGATKAVQRAKEFKPFRLPTPTTIEITLASTSQAARLASIPGVERNSERVVSYTSNDYLELYRVFVALCIFAITAADPYGY